MHFHEKSNINPSSVNPKNGQTHSNNSSTIGTKMFDELLSFCWVGL